MQTENVVAPLQRLAPFAGLNSEQLAEIARHAEKVKFRPGDFITRTGEPGLGAYLIVSGLADHAPGAGSLAAPQSIETGSLIGELAMLVVHDYAATITARDRVLCLFIARASMHAQMLRDPSLADHFVRYLTQKLSKVAEELRTIDRMLPPRRPAAQDHIGRDSANPSLPFRDGRRLPRLAG